MAGIYEKKTFRIAELERAEKLLGPLKGPACNGRGKSGSCQNWGGDCNNPVCGE